MFSWQPRELPAGRCALLRMGHLTLWIWHVPGEWRLAALQEEQPQATEYRDDLPVPREVGEWIRYTGPAANSTFRLLPALPALPLAISPASVMHLLPASRSELFVGIPVTVRVGIPYGGDTLTLAEHPVQPLAKTWFGQPDDPRGELCLSLRSRARLDVAELGPADPARAICALRLHNPTAAMLPLQSLALPTDPLGLAQDSEGRLWTTDVEVVFKGGGTEATLRYVEGAEAGQRTLLTPPRHSAAAGNFSSRLLGGPGR